MTEKFIARHCIDCEFRIHSRFESYPFPDTCGEIDDEGCRTVGELEKMTVAQCRKGYKK